MKGEISIAAVKVLAEDLFTVLAGHAPAVQGTALADCVAMWLAGHHVAGDAAATRSMRAEILDRHCSTVRRLVPINAKVIGTTA